jgi:hypothetical protein
MILEKEEAVDLMYGKGSRIEVHNWTHNIEGETFIFELIVHLGDTINESVIDTNYSRSIIERCLSNFSILKLKNISCMVRFDV